MASAVLAGCATTGGPVAPIQIQRAEVAVAVSCVPASLGAEPVYPDTDEALRGAAGPAERYQLLAAGRLLRMQRNGELEAVIRGCR